MEAYKLKIGLLSEDEMIMAGYSTEEDGDYNQYNWLYNIVTNDIWSFSPWGASNTENILFGDRTFKMSDADVKNSYSVLPIINLKTDTVVKGGIGTQYDPFIIK